MFSQHLNHHGCMYRYKLQHVLNGYSTKQAKADEDEQVYYFYSYGTAAWLSMSFPASFGATTSLLMRKNSDAIRASHHLPHNDRSITVARGSRSDEYVTPQFACTLGRTNSLTTRNSSRSLLQPLARPHADSAGNSYCATHRLCSII